MNTENQLDYFAEDKPDVLELSKQYSYSLSELNYYFHQTRSSYDDRRSYWNGKSADFRKHGADAFPWDGASDIEAPIIEERISTYVSLMMAALRRSNIRAYPVETADATQANVISGFLRWMVNSYIPNFSREMEAQANYLLEKGIIVTFTGWQKENRTILQKFSIEELAMQSKEFAELISDEKNDEVVISLLYQMFPNLIEKRAKKALKKLRKVGYSEFPVSQKKVDAPFVKALRSDGDVFFPPWTRDVDRAPYMFYREYLTAQEIRNKVKTDGWDEKWAEHVIENYRGKFNDKIMSEFAQREASPYTREQQSEGSDLVEVIYCYQKLIDREDDSIGIYLTVFHPQYTGEEHDCKYAKYELQEGMLEYPVEVTKLSEQSVRLYDVKTFSDLLRSAQWQIKACRDARIDKESLTTCPPRMHPAGRPPQDWGPGRDVPYRRPGELMYGPTPPPSSDAAQVDQFLTQQSDRLVGLDYDQPNNSIRQEFFINKFLEHVKKVLKACYKNFKMYGPDKLFFRVTGISEQMLIESNNVSEELDIMINFDTTNYDPETVEKKALMMQNLLSLDRQGKIDINAYIEMAGNIIDPLMADMIMQPMEQAQEKLVKDITSDLTSIYSGIEVGARPNGAQVALQLIQQYAQQPDIAQRLQADKIFAERLNKYMQQYQMQIMQQQNAQIGRIGTNPAQMGSVNTQNIN